MKRPKQSLAKLEPAPRTPLGYLDGVTSLLSSHSHPLSGIDNVHVKIKAFPINPFAYHVHHDKRKGEGIFSGSKAQSRDVITAADDVRSACLS